MLVTSAGQGHGTGAATPAPAAQFTPLTAEVITKPTPFVATDGKTHISYELLTTSSLPTSTPLRSEVGSVTCANESSSDVTAAPTQTSRQAMSARGSTL